VVLPDAEIMRNAQVQNAIVDRGTVIPEGMRIGFDPEEDRAAGLRITDGGRTLVTAEMLGQFLYHTR
jgi:glucose-1-phosphate adenylyltransferase